MDTQRQQTNASVTGQTGTEAGFLDAHFAACRPEYEQGAGGSARCGPSAGRERSGPGSNRGPPRAN